MKIILIKVYLKKASNDFLQILGFKDLNSEYYGQLIIVWNLIYL